MAGIMICAKCGGSLQGYTRNGEVIYRCSICGGETTSLPTKMPDLRKGMEEKRRERRDI